MRIPERLRRLFRLSELAHGLLRGDTVFPAYGTLYVESNVATEELRTQIGATWPHAIGGKAYTRLPSPLRRSRNTREIAILIGAIGRFGNAVIQVTNAGYLARLLGARRVLYFRFEESRSSGFNIDDDLAFCRVRAIRPANTAPDIIWRTDAIYRGGLLFDPCELPARDISTGLRGALGLSGPSHPSDGTLTIHLRGGDIFGPQPHKDYGQPPMSFFLRVMESQAWESITLVTEDDLNPCIQGILRWCQESKVPLRRTGQESIKAAVSELGSAKNVVLSSGTFGPAALFLYPLSRRVFFFGHDRHPLLCDAKGEFFRVADREGSYVKEVMTGNWSNSPAQRELMMNYQQDYLAPIEALGPSL